MSSNYGFFMHQQFIKVVATKADAEAKTIGSIESAQTMIGAANCLKKVGQSFFCDKIESVKKTNPNTKIGTAISGFASITRSAINKRAVKLLQKKLKPSGTSR